MLFVVELNIVGLHILLLPVVIRRLRTAVLVILTLIGGRDELLVLRDRQTLLLRGSASLEGIRRLQKMDVSWGGLISLPLDVLRGVWSLHLGLLLKLNHDLLFVYRLGILGHWKLSLFLGFARGQVNDDSGLFLARLDLDIHFGLTGLTVNVRRRPESD